MVLITQFKKMAERSEQESDNGLPLSKKSRPYGKVVLVTGGSGMVGRTLQEIVEKDRASEEKWIFASMKDADLR